MTEGIGSEAIGCAQVVAAILIILAIITGLIIWLGWWGIAASLVFLAIVVVGVAIWINS